MRTTHLPWLLCSLCSTACGNDATDVPAPESAADSGSQDAEASGASQGVDSGVPPGDAGQSALAQSGTITFTIRNETEVPLSLPGVGGPGGRWLEIGHTGYSLWPASSVQGNTLCDADPLALGEIPPPGAEIPVGGEYSYTWKANAFVGAQPIPGMSEEYKCATVSPVPLGLQQFLICARQSDVLCRAEGTNDYPPRLLCGSTMATVVSGDAAAEFAFDGNDFPTENCPQAEEIPKP